MDNSKPQPVVFIVVILSLLLLCAGGFGYMAFAAWLKHVEVMAPADRPTDHQVLKDDIADLRRSIDHSRRHESELNDRLFRVEGRLSLPAWKPGKTGDGPPIGDGPQK